MQERATGQQGRTRVNPSGSRLGMRQVAVVLAAAVVLAGAVAMPVGSASATEAAPVLSVTPAEAVPLRAGSGKRSIAPTSAELTAGVYLGGFGIGRDPKRRATGSLDDTQVRALVLESAGPRLVLVTVDAVGMGNRVQRAIRDGIAAATGISARSVLVNASHSHAAIDLQGLWGGVPASYRQRVVSQTVGAVSDALAQMEEVEAVAGTIEVPELHGNRRGVPDNTDDTLSVLGLRRAGGTMVSTLVNYGVHPTVIGSANQLVATDFVGSLRTTLDDALGGTSLFMNGALGDASPRPPSGTASSLGEAIAARAQTALAEGSIVAPVLKVASRQVTFELGPESLLLIPVSSPLLASSLGIDLTTYYDFQQVGSVYRYTSTVTAIELGDAQFSVGLVTAPGEPLSNLSKLELRPLMGADVTFVLGLTTDTIGYLVPFDEWRSPPVPADDRYEEGISLERAAGRKVVTAASDAWAIRSELPLAGFTDVASGIYYDRAVDWLAYWEITTGFGPPGRYSPDATVTRGQMALFLWRMSSKPDAPLDCGFTDLPATATDDLRTATCWLKDRGITTGYGGSPTQFAPAVTVDRGQMAAFLWRLAGSPGAQEFCGYRDAPSNADFRRGSCWLKTYGITTGYGGDAGRYAPNISVSRGQMAAFLWRLQRTSGAWVVPQPPTPVF
jgi:hypothetical protein